MNVSEAVRTRQSCRAFKADPVPMKTVRSIVDDARWSASGSNLQPWFVHVVAGHALERLKAAVAGRLDLLPAAEGTEYPIHPHGMQDPYRARRFECGERLYASIDIPRSDRAARLRQFARNFELFGAPVGLFFSIDRHMGPGQWADVGMYVNTVMLLARERGLHTCAQQAWASWHRTIGQFLDLPEHRMLYCGMALGWMDEDHPINSWRTDRAPLEDFCSFLTE